MNIMDAEAFSQAYQVFSGEQGPYTAEDVAEDDPTHIWSLYRGKDQNTYAVSGYNPAFAYGYLLGNVPWSRQGITALCPKALSGQPNVAHPPPVGTADEAVASKVAEMLQDRAQIQLEKGLPLYHGGGFNAEHHEIQNGMWLSLTEESALAETVITGSEADVNVTTLTMTAPLKLAIVPAASSIGYVAGSSGIDHAGMRASLEAACDRAGVAGFLHQPWNGDIQEVFLAKPAQVSQVAGSRRVTLSESVAGASEVRGQRDEAMSM